MEPTMMLANYLQADTQSPRQQHVSPQKASPKTVFFVVLLFLGLLLYPQAAEARISWPYGHNHWLHFKATAYSVTGETKAQTFTKEGRTLAADPTVLPIGTLVEVRRAGPYSGQYVVQDTGEKIVGRKIDIYIASTPEAKQFGVRNVRVRILKPAPVTPSEQRKAAAETPVAPKPPKDERVSPYYQYPPKEDTQTANAQQQQQQPQSQQ
jgi:3D (Asp-Asp-Asp) domain-containing protein